MVLMPGCQCDSVCGCGAGEKLPYTVTVEFDGLVNRTHSRHADLTFFSSFGSGATGVLLGPGGCYDGEPVMCGPSDRGPITGVLLTGGGSGYAVYGRSPPELTISATPGSGATFTPTLAEGSFNGLPYWYITSISVAGGTGYKNESPLVIALDDCKCTVATPAAATLYTNIGRIEPTVVANATGGTGASLSVTLASNGGSPETWGVSAVSVTDGGTGFTDQSVSIAFACSDGVTVSAATADALVAIDTVTAPVVTWDSSEASGSGFDAMVAFEVVTEFPFFPGDGRPFWTAASITITDGGTGYQVGEQLFSVFTEPGNWTSEFPPYITITAVDEAGAVTEFAIEDQGVYRKYTGAIESVTVTSPGAYYRTGDNGVPNKITVTAAGEYYCVDKTAEPIVADVTVSAQSGGGQGAVISATVDTDVNSPTFGSISSISLDDAGENYLAWKWLCAGHASLNGQPFVLRASDPIPAVTISIESNFGCGASAVVDNAGPKVAPNLQLRPVCSTDAKNSCTGASLVPTVTYDATSGLWSIASVAASGGTNCVDCTSVAVESSTCLTTVESATITLASANGSVTGATVVNGGQYYSRYEWDGQPSQIYSVSVTDGGSGYAFVGTGGVVVAADVVVKVHQSSASSGVGANLTAVIDQDPESETFGTVTAINVVNGGSGYTLFGGPRDCRYEGGCRSSGCDYVDPLVRAYVQGGEPLHVVLSDSVIPYGETLASLVEAHFSGADVTSCELLPSSATLSYGAPSGSASLSMGGVWNQRGDDNCADIECICPLELVTDLQATPVSVESDCPCLDGMLSGNGTLGDDGILSDCELGGVSITLAVSVDCCTRQCPDTGLCVQKTRVTFSAYSWDEEENSLSIFGTTECSDDDLTVEGGVLTGTVSVVADILSAGAEMPYPTCTATITFG